MKSELHWLDYSNKCVWNNWLSKLPQKEQDIYCDPDYVMLYTKDPAHANCYVYSSGENLYLYPFIKEPLPRMTDYFDIITPYGYGGPISNTNDIKFLQEAYNLFIEEALRRKVIAEVIKFNPLISNHLLLSNIYKGDIKFMCPIVYVETKIDEKYRWEHIYSHANRKKINKASKANLEYFINQSDESWSAFKALYNETMKANTAENFYYFSEIYFDNIRKNLSDKYILASCAIDGKIISVVLMLLGKQFVYFHLSGTDRNYMTFGVNNYLYHKIILWCKNKGYEKLLMGGGRSNSENDLLLHFKKNFSNKVDSFYVGEHILNKTIYNLACADWANSNPGREESVRLLKYRLS